jgi:hypothetical protein
MHWLLGASPILDLWEFLKIPPSFHLILTEIMVQGDKEKGGATRNRQKNWSEKEVRKMCLIYRGNCVPSTWASNSSSICKLISVVPPMSQIWKSCSLPSRLTFCDRAMNQSQLFRRLYLDCRWHIITLTKPLLWSIKWIIILLKRH